MDEYETIDNFRIIWTLQKGTQGTIKLAVEKHTGQLYALKVVTGPPEKLKEGYRDLQRELLVSRILDTSFISRTLRVVVKDKTLDSQFPSAMSMAYSVMEYAPNGDLCDLLIKSHALESNLARFYFQSMIRILESLHGASISHRDIKPENFLLDSKMRLMLTDFGFATVAEEGPVSKTRIGSTSYAAPEIIQGRAYDPRKADIFALGVVLFLMVLGYLPFKMACERDRRFALFATSPLSFWELHISRSPNACLKRNLMDLISGLLCVDPKKRLCMEDIKRSS
jgi:serine/threonine protein kinase